MVYGNVLQQPEQFKALTFYLYYNDGIGITCPHKKTFITPLLNHCAACDIINH